MMTGATTNSNSVVDKPGLGSEFQSDSKTDNTNLTTPLKAQLPGSNCDPNVYSPCEDSLLLNDPPFYYEPNNYPAPWKDDGIRGRVIDGNKISKFIRDKVKVRLEKIKEKYSISESDRDGNFTIRSPGLTVIIIGNDPASKVYVGRKQKACSEVGIVSNLLQLPDTTTSDDLALTLEQLNQDESVDGILLQLPLPNEELRDNLSRFLSLIHPSKDVDGFHPLNLGRLMAREPNLRPCTPFGVMHLLWSTGVNPYGLRCLVVGASNHVGRPMLMELLLNGCSVMVAHVFTPEEDLKRFVSEAECVIVAVGKPGIVKGEWIRDGAIVIDIGINRIQVPNPDYQPGVEGSNSTKSKLVGDVEFDVAKNRASWITPVPGGVGPMTVAMLLQNTITAYEDAMDLKYQS